MITRQCCNQSEFGVLTIFVYNTFECESKRKLHATNKEKNGIIVTYTKQYTYKIVQVSNCRLFARQCCNQSAFQLETMLS